MIEIAAPGVSARIDPAHGGRLVSLSFAGTEVLGGAEPEPGDHPGFYSGAFPMAPFTGRLAGGGVRASGEWVALPPTHAAGHVDHGIVHSDEWEVRRAESDRVELVHAVGDPWPFPGSLRMRVRLRPGELSWRMRLTGLGPATIGVHPWFRRDIGVGSPAVVEIASTGWLVGDRVVSTEPAHPRDDVAVGVIGDPVVRWGDALTLTCSSIRARAWVVCETFPGAVALEPLSDTPAALTREHVRPGPTTVDLDWTVRAQSPMRIDAVPSGSTVI